MTQFTDITAEEIDALIKRLEEADQHQFVLASEDVQLIIAALSSLVNLQDNIASKGSSLDKLRRLCGFIESSEKNKKRSEDDDCSSRSHGAKQNKNARSKPKPNVEPIPETVVFHALKNYKKGDTCPECERGTLNESDKPGTFLRIKAQTPFIKERHVLQRLRCNACGKYFTAEPSDDVKEDGPREQMYGHSARTFIAISKYYMGSPFYRQESLQTLLGVPISASTQYDQIVGLCYAIDPVYNYLKLLAANAVAYWIDDTKCRILDKKAEKKKCRRTGKETLRTGVYTSGLIAKMADGKQVVLFQTNIGHAGEFFNDIYQHRAPDLLPGILMSDALPSNRPADEKVIVSLCNSHARRHFFELKTRFVEEVNHLLEQYGKIWGFDQDTDGMTPCERLDYHKTHSLPVMEGILSWCQHQLETQQTEENSGLGKAMRYFIDHYKGLTEFCRTEGVALDNNIMEAELKLIVRDRKNGLFRKTQSGADSGDVLTSIIATTIWSGNNLFPYLNLLQRDRVKVRKHPERYLPWNFTKQL